jgi:hypothetical protein
VGHDSSVGIATRYGMNGPGIESRWRQDLPHPSISTLGLTQPLIQWVPGLLPEVKRQGHGGDHPPHLASRFSNSRVILVLHLWALMVCSRVNFTFFFYLYLSLIITSKILIVAIFVTADCTYIKYTPACPNPHTER